MNKMYIQPSVKVIKIQHSQMICGSPGAHDEYSDKPSYAQERRGWFDNGDNIEIGGKQGSLWSE